RGQDLVGGEVRGEDAPQEAVQRDGAGAGRGGQRDPRGEREQHGGQVRGRVAVRDTAADRAPGAHLLVGEDGERVGQGGERGRDARVALQRPVRGEGRAGGGASGVYDQAGQLGDAAHRDERRRGRQPALHQRQ